MENSILPNREVILNGIKYNIHGLVHGVAFVNISSNLKKEISSCLDGCNVLCEDGFTSWIKKSNSMNEIGYFKLNRISFIDFSNFWFSLISSKIFKPKEEPEIVSKVKKMNSIKDMNEIREELFKGYYSEPEGMNLTLEKAGCGTISSPKGDIPLKIRRYIYEAKFSLDYANRNNFKDLHIVVGCAHERPLEYLLKNSDILDKYIL